MFDSLSDNLSKVFSKLKGKGVLSENDVNAAMREVRVALLEADVSLSVVKDFVNKVKELAVGRDVIRSVSPGQMVIKIVKDNLVQMLGSDESELNLKANPPVVIMMVGLQGSGKTTSTGKLAHYLTKNSNKKIMIASLDVYRPAAQQQLAVIGKQISIDTLPIIDGEDPVTIASRALDVGKKEGYDIILLDTAGRLHIDNKLMDELILVKQLSNPTETLLVADALTGQDAVNIASQFNEKIGITGIILTRIDGDGRGGAALSMRAVTNCPIKFMGVGEKISEFEAFHPNRIASLILGMGDVVSLVERAAQYVNTEDAKRLETKIKKGQFDLNDLSKQFKMMRKMGGIGGMASMLPGIGKIKKQIDDANIDDKMIIHQEAMISSMTKQERRYPNIINGARKRRIAAGSGLTVPDLNRLLKQYKQMSVMMKKISKMDKKTLMRGGLGKFMPKDIS
jgi:signal recognition particle subunit SRP54